MDHRSLVELNGLQVSHCGYCKGEASIVHGIQAHILTAFDYQSLIDRGWRRCGTFCYKPINESTCCPSYSIRCDALNFKLSKSHKKILKRMTRFLRDGKRDQNEEPEVLKQKQEEQQREEMQQQKAQQEKRKKKRELQVQSCEEVGDSVAVQERDRKKLHLPLKNTEITAASRASLEATRAAAVTVADATVAAVTAAATIAAASATVSAALRKKSAHETISFQNESDANTSGSSAASNVSGSSQSSCKKAKQMRLERREAKMAAKGLDTEMSPPKPKGNDSQEKTLKSFIHETSPNDRHKLKVVLVASDTKSSFNNVAYQLYCKYQVVIHNDNPARLTHASMKRFLYRTPLKNEKARPNSDIVFGTYHQQYWLDDKLIAVGVIDILPYCVSSVYFFYDPDYSFLSLGTYGSLREIEYVQRLAREVPELKYYYMGYYIHSISKMAYKAKLTPSYLLCPETFEWELYTDALRSKLDENDYQRLNIDPTVGDPDDFQWENVQEIVLEFSSRETILYEAYARLRGAEDLSDMLYQYGKLVGRTLAYRMHVKQVL